MSACNYAVATGGDALVKVVYVVESLHRLLVPVMLPPLWIKAPPCLKLTKRLRFPKKNY